MLWGRSCKSRVVTLNTGEIENTVVASLSDEERSRVVVYLDERVLEPGDELEIDGRRIGVDSPTVVGFADLEPGMNWGHRGRYLLVDRESGDVRAVDAEFPPFLRGV